MNFIHLKGNLLVSSTGNKYTVKVSDFGMAKVLGENSYYKSDNVTLPYKWCSVEVLKYGKFSFASDVWAFGILLWELFSMGETPYLGFSNSEASEKVIQGYRLPQPKNCSDEMYKLMKQCWNENPKDRPTMKDIHSTLSTEKTENQQSFLAFILPPSANKKPESPVYHM